MKKYIAAFDGLKYAESTRDYAIQLAVQNSAHLIGVFMDDITYHSYKIHELIRKEGGISDEQQIKLEQQDAKKRIIATDNFEQSCREAGLAYSVHHDKSIAIQELLHESIFADLLIMNSGETMTHFTENIPSVFIRDLLSNIQCATLLVPREFQPISRLTLLYDGEPSSVYAFKMLGYTIPLIQQLPTEIVTVIPEGNAVHLPDDNLMKEFLHLHFPDAVPVVLKGMPETEILNHLKNKNENNLVVLGAYRRGMVSRWFRQSMADILMKNVSFPLFIAHNK